jgi:hypothetical protein
VLAPAVGRELPHPAVGSGQPAAGREEPAPGSGPPVASGENSEPRIPNPEPQER